MNIKHFQNIKTLDELKVAFRKLAKKHHPDLGGNEETMKEINLEYDHLKQKLSRGQKDGTTEEDMNAFRDIINNLIHLNLEIEICGRWIWVSGDTWPHRETLKANGLRWAKRKKMWFWKPADSGSKKRTSTPMDKIREKYGSQKVTKKKTVLSIQ